MNNVMKNIVMGICFIVCMALIIVGQKTIGLANLGMMIVGLGGLLVLLYLYNRKYK